VGWAHVIGLLVVATVWGGLLIVGSNLRGARVDAQPMRIEQAPHARQEPNRWARWSVTEQRAAHDVIMVHVETRYLDEARAIAQQLVEPSKSRYAEVLIYFHRPGRPDVLAARRIQWTPKNGYLETVYAP
jgi:hypothetical protein